MCVSAGPGAWSELIDRNSTDRDCSALAGAADGEGGAVGGGRSDSGTALETLGKSPRFTVLTHPESGFSVYRYGDSDDPGFPAPGAASRPS